MDFQNKRWGVKSMNENILDGLSMNIEQSNMDKLRSVFPDSKTTAFPSNKWPSEKNTAGKASGKNT